MAKLVRKNLQILDVFVQALGDLEHGGQQEAVNAALVMFYMADEDRKRFWVRVFREVMDGDYKISIRKTGEGSLLYSLGSEDEERTLEIESRLFGGDPKYFNPGSIRDLADRMDEAHKALMERIREKYSRKRPATELVTEVANQKPKPRQRRKAT